jgi:hypothetical protein
MAQEDNFQEVKRHKRHISNNTSQAVTKLNKPVPTSAAVKLLSKAVLTRNFVTALTTTEMDMETTEAENTPPEQEVPRKPSRSPPIVMTSTTNLNQLRSDLKDHVKGKY